MDLWLSHWHCIIPVIGIIAAMFFMNKKDKSKSEVSEDKNIEE